MTDPYYQDELITLYHGDCLQLAELWTTADVLVTDPPYGVAFQSSRRKVEKLARIAGDDNTLARDSVINAWGREKPAIVFGNWSIPAPPGEKRRLIWHKADTCGKRRSRRSLEQQRPRSGPTSRLRRLSGCRGTRYRTPAARSGRYTPQQTSGSASGRWNTR
ncbi:hypothetical protein OS128_05250 [Corynebacterium sp. P5848]|uniref:hypothetical protein n=1 Tax=Corynebacterium marambiense TaxID=2765364 RepID=UPI002260D31F|nr:hypothetical protein [Corynebacterium marambiense]MCX7542317.1 hypothetical protein [Corynebacterium marambiense]